MVYSFGVSKYEYHHIYPKQYFDNEDFVNSLDISEYVDKRVIKLREFEHFWIHYSPETLIDSGSTKYEKGFDGDWEKVNHDKTIKPTGVIIPIFTTRFAVTPYTKRKTAIILGSRLISYRIVTYDYDSHKVKGLLSGEFDLVSNLLYNTAYITAIPAKAISFGKFILQDRPVFKSGLLSVFGKFYLWAWLIIQLIWGFICAMVMLLVGTILGFLCHPLDSLGGLLFSFHDLFTTNLITSCYDFGVALLKPLINIFYWNF